MKSLIITVAGTATRFNRDTEQTTLKCLYNIDGYRNSLLYQILDKARDFDEFIIVGGYLFNTLNEFINHYLTEFKDRIKLIYNPEYENFGSGYSLILGINNVSEEADDIVFVEGDLFFNEEDFSKVKNSESNVLTVNHDIITSKKSVVVYETIENKLQYIYDTKHQYLAINEPFMAIYNSAQIWKFKDPDKLRAIIDNLSETQRRGTNLEIIQAYFGDLQSTEYNIVDFSEWYNCNTVADYKNVYLKIPK